MRLGRRAAAVAAVVLALLAVAPPAAAHPLGNFTVNYASHIRVEPAAVGVTVVEDSAEIPTLQAFPAAATGVEASAAAAHGEARCAELVATAALQLDGQRQQLAVVDASVTFPAGAAGLPTMRISCELRTTASVSTVGATLAYSLPADGRPGWREITAAGDGVQLAHSTVPARSPSAGLTAYPEDLLASPLAVQQATAEVLAGSGTVGGQADQTTPASISRGLDSLTTAYTQLVASRDLTLGFILLAGLLAAVLGAAHAFAPGHGKALMAAVLVGQGGTVRHATTIGLSVTVTHTLGVLLLGLLLSVTSVVAPSTVYTWLGLVNGLLLVLLGAALLRAALRRTTPTLSTAVPEPMPVAVEHHHHDHDHDHDHDHGHDHDHHHAAPHSHGLTTHTHGPVQPGVRGLLAAGFAGGLVPSPSALLVLLGGVALGRAWLGVLLVVAYGIGMAAALVATGLALARCRGWLAARGSQLSHRRTAVVLRLVTQWLPAAASAVVILGGLLVVTRTATLL